MENKVFCKNCKHYHWFFEQCLHPKNVRYNCKNGDRVPMEECEELNYNCDCDGYDGKN